MNAEDIINIRHDALKSHEKAAQILTDDLHQEEYEQQRDDCIEKKNAVKTILNECENQKEGIRSKKRKLDDEIGEINRLEREFKGYWDDLSLDIDRCNSEFWDRRKGRKIHDNYPDNATKPPHGRASTSAQ